jgi:hypothetical protein
MPSIGKLIAESMDSSESLRVSAAIMARYSTLHDWNLSQDAGSNDGKVKGKIYPDLMRASRPRKHMAQR